MCDFSDMIGGKDRDVSHVMACRKSLIQNYRIRHEVLLQYQKIKENLKFYRPTYEVNSTKMIVCSKELQKRLTNVFIDFYRIREEKTVRPCLKKQNSSAKSTK